MRRFIVVEGLIGVGKSSLCRLLRDKWGARLILEPADNNPFLALFYEDSARYGFPVQMYYLVNRWRQQEQIRQQDLFQELVVSDYLWEKDRLFAEMTLDDLELDLYDRFATALAEQAPVPDLLIYLHAPLDVLLRRIQRRRAPGENLIKREYLEDLRQRYERLLSNWTASPILRIDNSKINYVDEIDGRQRVLEKISEALGGEAPVVPGFTPNRENQPSLFGESGGYY